MKQSPASLVLFSLIITLCRVSQPVCAQVPVRPSHEGKVVLFGNLHAHSKLSDDIAGAGDELLPSEAFKYAHAHGLDFLAITDHHKATDSPNRLWMTAAEYKEKLFDVAMAYNAAHIEAFVAIPGIEWGNTATGNHVNVFGANVVPPDTIADTDYDELFEWAKLNAQMVQFNHPNSWKTQSNRNTSVGNYGRALYASDTEFVAKVDPAVQTISIISSVAGGHISGELRHSEDKTHREMQWEKYYKEFLNLGFHISPAAIQHTHWKKWGTVTAARTAVWASSGSYSDLMEGFKANRAYATEDDELVLVYQVRYKEKTYWMGESVLLESDEEDVEVVIKIWQGSGTDGDATDEGPYTVEIITDPDGIGGQEAAASTSNTYSGILSNTERVVPLQVVAGAYVYLHISEEAGKDNALGEGIDEVNNATGADGEDGKRDDMSDSAWTSPIWFHAVLFVWSKNSNLYHEPSCWAVKNISQSNKRTGPAPPGKTKHGCHP